MDMAKKSMMWSAVTFSPDGHGQKSQCGQLSHLVQMDTAKKPIVWSAFIFSHLFSWVLVCFTQWLLQTKQLSLKNKYIQTRIREKRERERKKEREKKKKREAKTFVSDKSKPFYVQRPAGSVPELLENTV